MKIITPILMLFLSTASIAAPFQFTGYVTVADKPQLRLTDLADGNSSGWLEVGQTFRGYTLFAFDPKTDILTLKRDSEILHLPLKDAKVAVTKESLKTNAGQKRPPEYAGTSYAMRRGDTALKIAKESGISVEALQKLNPEVNWARLRVGQAIRLPPEE